MFIVITSLQEVFKTIFDCGVLGKALKAKKWSLEIVNLYDFGLGKHKKIDDSPYSGGPGMVLLAEVVAAAIESVKARYPETIFYILSPRGERFCQVFARRINESQRPICLICGRFEGFDQRVIDYFAIPELSVGDFVLTCGEYASIIIIDACVRLLPNILGNTKSIECESFSVENKLEHNQYTRPHIWRGMQVPDVLVSGNHKMIKSFKDGNCNNKE